MLKYTVLSLMSQIKRMPSEFMQFTQAFLALPAEGFFSHELPVIFPVNRDCYSVTIIS